MFLIDVFICDADDAKSIGRKQLIDIVKYFYGIILNQRVVIMGLDFKALEGFGWQNFNLQGKEKGLTVRLKPLEEVCAEFIVKGLKVYHISLLVGRKALLQLEPGQVALECLAFVKVPEPVSWFRLFDRATVLL